MRLRSISALFISAALVLAPAAMASAETRSPAADPVTSPNAITWGVTPASADGPDSRYSFAYAINAGTLIQDRVAVSNKGTEAATFQLYAVAGLNNPDTGAFGLADAKVTKRDLAAWVHLPVSSVTVPPGQAVVVPFQVSVPTNAQPGDHTAGIVASITAKTTKAGGTGINIEQRVGTALYVRVNGDAVADLQVSGLVASYGGSWNPFGAGNATADYQVKNTGNARLDVKQDVVLKGPFGIPLAHITSVQPVLNLLPGQAVQEHVKTVGIAPLFSLFADVTLTPGPPTDSLAKSAEQDADGKPAAARPALDYAKVTSETLTGAVPWMLLLLIVVVVGLVWLVVRTIRNAQLRMWDAIDQATEEARESALQEVGAGRSGSSES